MKGGLGNTHFVKGEENKTMPVLYQWLVESQHFLVSADLPRFLQQRGLRTPCWILVPTRHSDGAPTYTDMTEKPTRHGR